ncbi:MAG: Ppx/GppA family phosphatase [Solirubrobacterales bacterium]|nr:Ppx/GppA family phosphatase [Solirubrobacterales bacterium]
MSELPKVIATVDIGTNSTRLLICSISTSPSGDLAISDLERHSNVTRLGDGVDANGHLDPAARERVLIALTGYKEIVDLYPVDAISGVLTSAGRDAADGREFTEEILARTGIAVRLISGDQEARLSFAGATSERKPDGQTILVCDVGGGSTELIVGRDSEILFHTSLAAGVVRQTERHIGLSDPPSSQQLELIAEEVRGLIDREVPDQFRTATTACIAVAGTATTLAAIDQSLEPYDPERVHGATVSLGRSREILKRIAALPLAERRDVAGLHPDRAPTAVAGAEILCTVLDCFALDRFTASEHDILRGEALRLLKS